MSIVKTLEAMCRDCYRCVRACPVKAIGIKNKPGVHQPGSLHQLRHLCENLPAKSKGRRKPAG